MSAPCINVIKRLQEAGATDEEIQAYLNGWMRPVPTLDEAAERRRARDREYQRQRRQISADNLPNDTKEKDNIINLDKSLSRSSRPTSADSRFAEFKAAYPKRNGQYAWPKAEKKFNQLVSKGVDAQLIIDGARRYAILQGTLGKIGTEYIQMPTTWLNGEMWRDESDGHKPEPAKVFRPGERFVTSSGKVF